MWDVLKNNLKDIDIKTVEKGEHTSSNLIDAIKGVLTRETGETSQEKDPKALNVDRENQLVVHDKGLEEGKKTLRGVADKLEDIPKNPVNYKPEGRYIIVQSNNFKYPKGTRVQLRFSGTYHGKQARFENIIVEVITPPRIIKGKKYIQVKLLYDQEIEVLETGKKVYFLKANGSFNIQL